jgi:hypothetical protein
LTIALLSSPRQPSDALIASAVTFFAAQLNQIVELAARHSMSQRV